MGDAARELADGLHLLGHEQPPLEGPAPALVPGDGEDEVAGADAHEGGRDLRGDGGAVGPGQVDELHADRPRLRHAGQVLPAGIRGVGGGEVVEPVVADVGRRPPEQLLGPAVRLEDLAGAVEEEEGVVRVLHQAAVALLGAAQARHGGGEGDGLGELAGGGDGEGADLGVVQVVAGRGEEEDAGRLPRREERDHQGRARSRGLEEVVLRRPRDPRLRPKKPSRAGPASSP